MVAQLWLIQAKLEIKLKPAWIESNPTRHLSHISLIKNSKIFSVKSTCGT